MAAKKCVLVCKPRWGAPLPPKECTSIKEAMEYAKAKKMTYRIFVDGKQVKRGF